MPYALLLPSSLNSSIQATVIESVMRIVHAGKAKGLPIAVASAGTRKHVQQSLEEAGITELFDAIVCGGEY